MKKIILFAIVLMVIASCKKTNSGSHTSGVLLSKFVEIDTTLSAPNDTLSVTTYRYDNLNRWTFEFDSTFANSSPLNGVPGERSTSAFYYIGSTTLPYMITGSEYYQGAFQDSDVDYLLSYSAEGLLKDSDVSITLVGPNQSITTQYQYNGSIVSDSLVNITYPASPTDYDTAMQTKVNGNIVAQINPTFNDGTFTASYDTHPNPFLYDNVSPGGFPSLAEGGDHDNLNIGQKNNLTEIDGISDEGNGEIHTKYQYTYNSNGYPATVVEYDWSSGSPVFVYKGFYFYQ